MAPSITGSITQIKTASNGSQTIAVPSDAQLCLVGSSHFLFGGLSFSTLTLGGSNFTPIGGYSGNTYEQVLLGQLTSPSTGNQTFAWAFNSAPTEGAVIFVVFLTGVDTTAPVTDYDIGAGASPVTTASFNSTTNDLCLCVVSSFDTTVDASGGGQTEVADSGTIYNRVYGAVGTKAGVSGATTMTATGNALSIVAVSISGTAAATGCTPLLLRIIEKY